MEIVTGFTEKIKSLGPLGVSEGLAREVLAFKLKAAKNLSQQEKFRWIIGKMTEFSKEGNAYGEVFTQHELNRLLLGLINEDLQVHEILELLETENLSVKELAQRTGLFPTAVLNHITALRRRNLVDLKEVKEGSPLYTLHHKEDEKQNGS